MDKLEKVKAFWRSYKRAIVLALGLTAAAPFLPVAVPILDAIAEAPALEKPVDAK